MQDFFLLLHFLFVSLFACVLVLFFFFPDRYNIQGSMFAFPFMKRNYLAGQCEHV